MEDYIVYRVDYQLNGNEEETFERTFHSFERMKDFADEVISNPRAKLVETSAYERKRFLCSSEVVSGAYNPDWAYIYDSHFFHVV